VKGAASCKEYVKNRLAAAAQIERIPVVAGKGIRAVDVVEQGDDYSKLLEEVLYQTSRSLIQINIEMRYAMGYADGMAPASGRKGNDGS